MASDAYIHTLTTCWINSIETVMEESYQCLIRLNRKLYGLMTLAFALGNCSEFTSIRSIYHEESNHLQNDRHTCCL